MQQIKILVVEDVPLTMKFTQHLMKNIGYKADYATNAEEALMLHYENQYDLIFNDIRLPKMNGLLMALKVRQFERKYCLTSTKIVTITSYNIASLKEEIRATGINAAMNKPVNAEHILKLIKSCEMNLAHV